MVLTTGLALEILPQTQHTTTSTFMDSSDNALAWGFFSPVNEQQFATRHFRINQITDSSIFQTQTSDTHLLLFLYIVCSAVFGFIVVLVVTPICHIIFLIIVIVVIVVIVILNRQCIPLLLSLS
jgi:hypothetical protein